MATSTDAVPVPGHHPASGWIEAGVYVLCIGLLSISYAVASMLGAHVIPFILYSMLLAAVALVAAVGPGEDWRAVILAPSSWLVGGAIIGMEIFYYILLEVVPPADGSLIIRLSIPLSLVVGLILLGRRPAARAWAGAALVVVAIVPLFWRLGLGLGSVGLWASLACSGVVVLRMYATEFHPWNRRARTVQEKLRVTGLVVMVSALAGLALAGLGVWLISVGALPAIRMLPAPHQFAHGPTLLVAAFVGGLVLTTMNYCIFSSVVKITSENVIAMTAFMPVATLVLQLIVGATGLVAFPALDLWLLPSMALAVIGVLIIIRAGRRA